MDNDTKHNGEQQPSQKKFPFALLFWSMLISVMVVMIFFKSSIFDRGDVWDQTKFEKHLDDGSILSAKIVSETDRVLLIDGDYKPALPVEGDSASKVKHYSTRVIFSDNLDARIHANIKNVQVEPREVWWKNIIVTILPFLLIVGILYFLFSRQIKMAGKGAMQFGKSRAKMIFPEDLKVTFDDIAGADEAKEETQEIIEYLKDPIKFKLLGAKLPKGALLMGPPGTGKTMLAKAVACEAGVPFFSISGSDFVEMFVGVGASRVRDMFEQARKNYPCVIFIDEIDAVGRSRFSGIGGGHDEREQTLNALLVEMDGLESIEGIIILAATNRADVLDPALTRPGRFDRQIMLDLPDIKGRRSILDVHVKEIKMDGKVDLDIIARGTPGFSGADLANLINEAALLAAKHDCDAATMEHFNEARDKVKWGRERKSRNFSEQERRMTAYHEAGHTLVGLHCSLSMPLHKVTIIPRGHYLGATMHLPLEDKHSQSKNELLDELAVAMGGRVAEEIVFKDITSGAAGDIEQSTRIARTMVCAFGMSDKLGVMQYGERAEHIYLGRDITRNESYSEETAREIDIEIKKILTEAKSRATAILINGRDKLDLLAKELLAKETLDVKEIETLLGIKKPPPPDTYALPSSNKEEDGTTSPPSPPVAPPLPA